MQNEEWRERERGKNAIYMKFKDMLNTLPAKPNDQTGFQNEEKKKVIIIIP